MITFSFTNAIQDGNKMRVFFRFSNNEECSNLFDMNATVIDINTWAEERALLYEEREMQLEEQRKNFIEEIILPNIID